jgi:hypothetical protein
MKGEWHFEKLNAHSSEPYVFLQALCLPWLSLFPGEENCYIYYQTLQKLTGVFDQTLDASLFYIELEWMKDVKDLFRTRQIEGTLSVQQK